MRLDVAMSSNESLYVDKCIVSDILRNLHLNKTDRLGCGHYGEVYRASAKNSPQHVVAVKICKTNWQTAKEKKILGDINGLNFLQKSHYSFDYSRKITVHVLHFYPYNLHTLMHQCQLKAEWKIRIIAELYFAICNLHRIGIVHADIKPENIMLDQRGRVVLIDFGLSVEEPKRYTRSEYVGTETYMAPETLFRRNFTKAIDYYSFGVTVFNIMISRKSILKNEPPTAVYVESRILPFVNKLENAGVVLLSSSEKTVLAGLLQTCYKKRTFFFENNFESCRVFNKINFDNLKIPNYCDNNFITYLFENYVSQNCS